MIYKNVEVLNGVGKEKCKKIRDGTLTKLNLVSREEFEVQKKMIEKLQDDFNKIKKTKNRKRPIKRKIKKVK